MALPQAWSRLLADVATGVWRLRRRLSPPQTEPAAPDLRRVVRDVEALWDALAQAGVVIQDHTGAVYDPTQALQVAAFEPSPQLDRERVIETLRPSVYFEAEWIQMGEVVVGTPPADGAAAKSSPEATFDPNQS